MSQTKKIQVLLVRVSNAVIKQHDQKNLGSKGLFHIIPDSHYQDRNREVGTGWPELTQRSWKSVACWLAPSLFA